MSCSAKIRIGPAGSDGLGPLKGVERVAQLGLECMEIAFTYGVRMKAADARAAGRLARSKRIRLSVHAPYYVNLAADDPAKRAAGKQRLMDACQRAHLLGAENVVFHAGFYQKKTARETFDRVLTAVDELQLAIQRNRWRVSLCPEVTGKTSQFGSLDELLKLKKAAGCGLCVDFAHLYARDQGRVDWPQLLARLPVRLHGHFSDIAFGPQGERKHLPVAADFFEPLAAALIKRGAAATIICESPQPYPDAHMMQNLVDRLQRA